MAHTGETRRDARPAAGAGRRRGWEGAGRRSIYRVVWRGMADPFMEALDFPELGLPAPVRGFSASPLQSLALLNNEFVLRHSEALAQRAETGGATTAERVRAMLRPRGCSSTRASFSFLAEGQSPRGIREREIVPDLGARGQRGYPARIRTLNNGTKIRCVTITPRGTRPANRREVHRRQRAGCKGRLRIFWQRMSFGGKPISAVPSGVVFVGASGLSRGRVSAFLSGRPG